MNNVINKPIETTELYPKYNCSNPCFTYTLAFLYSYKPLSNLLSS